MKGQAMREFGLYSLGYRTLGGIADLHAMLEVVRDAEAGVTPHLLDVRLKNVSRIRDWRGATLAAELGETYHWCPDLGNLNYKGQGPIKLANPRRGFKTARALLAAAPMIVMCGCPIEAYCHRRRVLRRLRSEWTIYVLDADLASE